MLSKKTRYAMMALIHLARQYGNGAIQISDIAKEENIPQRFLKNILLEAKRIGLLGSKLGKSGGYYLIHPPKEINMSQIIRHFEGTIALIHCVSEKAYQPCEFCKDEASCKIRRLFKTIRDQTFDILDGTTLADMV
ncbi:MAG: Rrf2 family transcriptional regulator [Breznakibacter sp.]